MVTLFGKSRRDEARSKAREEYEEACAADPVSRAGRALTIRAGARAKAHFDKTFISGAEKAIAYDNARQIALSNGEDRPEPPKASEYQVIKAVNGELVVYMPAGFAERVFRLGMRYQTMEITAEQAVAMAQQIADQISLELQLEQPFVALEFLREEIKESSGEASGDDKAGDPASAAAPNDSAARSGAKSGGRS